jgi:peptidoglycan/xylan/chitin deacetylase (PgdA/CDA1 family)
MYHRVLARPVSPYDISIKDFKSELARLYRTGYRPIRASDLIARRIDLPTGTSPVVLTFDDSSFAQFGYTKGRHIDPKTALGILIDFAKHHEGFDAIASLYVNSYPFGDSRGMEMLKDLHKRGFELGNHTLHHANLGRSTPRTVRQELALGWRLIKRAVPRVRVETVALPYGRKPNPERLARTGSWNGIRYVHRGVLLAGSGPAPSPFNIGFDPYEIPRIMSKARAGKRIDGGSRYWLRSLRLHPSKRYVSDGHPRFVSFPRRLKDELRRGLSARPLPYVTRRVAIGSAHASIER